MEDRRKILVVGGTGYLGQHLIQFLSTSKSFEIAFTHHRPIPLQELLDALPSVKSFQVDVRTGEGFNAVSASFGQPDVVVNCAAISVPRACEMDAEAAMATNEPSSLVKWLLGYGNNNSLLIHLSTDQGICLFFYAFRCCKFTILTSWRAYTSEKNMYAFFKAQNKIMYNHFVLYYLKEPKLPPFSSSFGRSKK